MTRSGCCWVVALVLAGSARAQAEVVVDSGAPFTAGELREALAIRQAAPAEVVVHVVSPTVIELETSGGGLRIELGAARGVEAARLVALQWTAIDAVAAPAPEVLAPPGLTAVAPPPGLPGGPMFGLTAGVGIGISATDLTLSSVTGDVVWRHERWLWGGGVTWLHGSTVQQPSTLVSMDFGLVRAQLGRTFGRFTVFAGPALVLFRALSARVGAVAGASANVNADLITSGAWRVFVRVEFDATLQSPDYPDPNPISTPRATASAALGVAWGRL